MKQFRTFTEVKSNVPSDLESEIEDIVNKFRRQEDIAGEFDFEEYFGGCVFLVEELSDLKEILTHVVNIESNEWDNLLNTHSSFDIAEYVCNGNYAFIFDITNNSGGPSYYIPRAIADQCDHVAMAIDLSEPLS